MIRTRVNTSTIQESVTKENALTRHIASILFNTKSSMFRLNVVISCKTEYMFLHTMLRPRQTRVDENRLLSGNILRRMQ